MEESGGKEGRGDSLLVRTKEPGKGSRSGTGGTATEARTLGHCQGMMVIGGAYSDFVLLTRDSKKQHSVRHDYGV